MFNSLWETSASLRGLCFVLFCSVLVQEHLSLLRKPTWFGFVHLCVLVQGLFEIFGGFVILWLRLSLLLSWPHLEIPVTRAINTEFCLFSLWCWCWCWCCLFMRCVWTKEARVGFRVRVPPPVRYGGTTILRKIGYGYGGDICFIKFFYILLCIYFSYIDKHMWI